MTNMLQVSDWNIAIVRREIDPIHGCIPHCLIDKDPLGSIFQMGRGAQVGGFPRFSQTSFWYNIIINK